MMPRGGQRPAGGARALSGPLPTPAALPAQAASSPAKPSSSAPPVHFASESCRTAAEEVASRLGSRLVFGAPGDEGPGTSLLVDESGLWLCGDGLRTQGDFTRLIPRLRPRALARELLVKAARVKGVERPRAIDATAGLGEDSLLLAATGFEVELYERDPVICELLRDALLRAESQAGLAPFVAHMHLHEGDSAAALRALAMGGVRPDVVFLDPMFPARQKSALVKKKFQLIHRIEAPASDEDELLAAALAARPRKVVIKRPPKGPFLAGRKPGHSVVGKAVRYDVIVPPPQA